MKYVLLSVFGLVGIYTRYFLTSSLATLGTPVATIAINIVGSFLMGIVYVLGVQKQLVSDDLRIGLMTGLLGGFTTFSAFSLDAVTMIAERQYLASTLYILGSVGGSIAAVAFGLSIGKWSFGV